MNATTTTTNGRRHPRWYYISWILRQYRNHGRMVGLMLFLTVLTTAASVLLPRLFGHVIDNLTVNLEAFRAGRLALDTALAERNRSLLLLLVIGLGHLIAPVYPWLRTVMNLAFERRFREEFFRSVLAREPDFFLRFRTGDLVTRLADNLRNAPSGLPWLCCSGIFRALTAVSIIGACLLGMFHLHAGLALAACVPLPFMLLAFLKLQTTMEARCEAVQEKASDTTAFLESAFSGIRILKAFTAEAPQTTAFRHQLEERRGLELAQARTEGLFQIYFEFLTYLGEILVLIFGGILVVRGTLTLGAYYAFFSYLGMILPMVMDIPMLLITLSGAFVVIDRLEEIQGEEKGDVLPFLKPAPGAGKFSTECPPFSRLASQGNGPAPVPGISSRAAPARGGNPVNPDGIGREVDASPGEPRGSKAQTAGPRVTCPPFQRLEMKEVSFAYPVPERVAQPGQAGETSGTDGNGESARAGGTAGAGAATEAAAAVAVAARVPAGKPFSLQDISFDLRRGEKVAVMGPIGSGKSTLLQLAAGLLDPAAGEIRIDDRPLADLDRRVWRERLGFVQQEPVVFSATVRDNIDFWRNYGPERTLEAAELAQIKTEIEGLPGGFDERLGTRGTGLSGGQRQRLSLARALAGRPELLLMDDVTAGLDAANERTLWRRLRAAAPDLTCLIVTHRAATARVADRILVVDRGRLVASGRHADLVRTSPLYRELIGLRRSVGRPVGTHRRSPRPALVTA